MEDFNPNIREQVLSLSVSQLKIKCPSKTMVFGPTGTQWSTKGQKSTAVAEGEKPMAAEGIWSQSPNGWPKVKPASEGHKFEKSAILFEKNWILKDILPIMSHFF